MRSLATCVDSIRTEQASRREAAEQAAAEIDSLAAQVRGPEAAAETTEDDEGAEGDETAAAVVEEPEPEPAPMVTAAVSRPH
ncbi:hypothetical protein [Streptomyces sp. NPDC058279]|uniref:hypothetical protein n=1 Tax=Streptomyces sp. NPDC058279 TaxID=3346418 RepID=UPI0036F17079